MVMLPVLHVVNEWQTISDNTISIIDKSWVEWIPFSEEVLIGRCNSDCSID